MGRDDAGGGVDGAGERVIWMRGGMEVTFGKNERIVARDREMEKAGASLLKR